MEQRIKSYLFIYHFYPIKPVIYLQLKSPWKHLSVINIKRKSFSCFGHQISSLLYTNIPRNNHVWLERFITKEILGRYPRSWWCCIYMGFILICNECKYLFNSTVALVTKYHFDYRAYLVKWNTINPFLSLIWIQQHFHSILYHFYSRDWDKNTIIKSQCQLFHQTKTQSKYFE